MSHPAAQGHRISLQVEPARHVLDMINRNIGIVERVVRFALAVIVVGWILSSERFGLAQGGAVLIAFALLWNSIFGRCYLWSWLGLSSCGPNDDCSAGGGDSTA